MGKRRGGRKIINLDPIVKFIKKKYPKVQETQPVENDQPEENRIQEDFLEKLHKNSNLIHVKEHIQSSRNSHYDKFLNQFVNQDNKLQQEGNRDASSLLKSIQAKKAFYERNPQNNILKAKIRYQITQDSLFQHFNKDFKDIIASYLQKNDEIPVQLEFQQNVVQMFVEDQTKVQKSVVNQEVKQQLLDTLNNRLKIQDMSMQPQFKKKFAVQFEGLSSEDYYIEQIVKDQIYQNNLVLLNNEQEVKDESQSQRDQLMQNIIKNYFDYQFVDPDEEFNKDFRNIYIKHILDHINSHLKIDSLKNTESEDVVQEISSKGFNRPKVLILCPFKGDAINIIDTLIELHRKNKKSKVIFHDRYITEFADEQRVMEDNFRIGISFSPKGNIKLFTQFDKADIIIAAPLGLRLIVGNDADRYREFHFLSSIEVLVIDRASAIAMQNWQHLESVLENLNQIPDHKFVSSGIDEIRPYYWEKGSQFYRQNIVYSAHNFTELNHLRLHYFKNYKGRIENKIYYMPVFTPDFSNNFQQEFINFDSANPEDGLINRFNLFKKIWNNIEGKELENYKKTVIFAQSYFDFIKLKNHFKKINSLVQCVSEYTPKPKVQSIVSKFNAGKIPFLLITERAFYFEVLQIRKMKHLLFFQLPQHADIYKGLIETIYDETTSKFQPSAYNKILILFCKYDAYQLEQIVGTQQTQEMLNPSNKGSTFII